MNEFVARNGLIALDSSSISGPLTVSGSVSISGSSPLIQLGSTSFVGDVTNPAITFGSTSNGIYTDSNRVFFKAGGSFAGGFSSAGLQGNQIQIRNSAFNDLTTAMYIPYRLNAIGLLAGLGGNDTGALTLITSGSARLYISSSGNIGIGTTSPTALLDVRGDALISGSTTLRGSSTTSATTALTVQNSSSTNLFSVDNAGTIRVGGSFITFVGDTNPFRVLHRADISDGILFAANSNTTITSGNKNTLRISETFAPTSGNATLVTQTINPTINQTGGANGITRGLYVNPTLTSAADFRAIEWSNNAATAPSASWGLYGAGTAPNYLAGSLGIGSTSLTVTNLRISKNIEGGTSAYGVLLDSSIRSGVTSQALGFTSSPSIQNSAFTVSQLRHFYAIGISSAGSATITNQSGFYVENSFTGATNNYGFISDIPSGTGRWNLYMNGTADNYLAGRLGIGSTSLTNTTLRIGNNITGASSHFSIFASQTVQSDVANASIFTTEISTQATAFTLNTLRHYRATQGTFGASSIVTNQYGFFAESTLINATNNYGFWGDIPSGTGRWNLYMNGTANNYLAGALGINSTNLTGYSLRVDKNLTGATIAFGVYSGGQINSDVTSTAYLFRTRAFTQAASFTLSSLMHYNASNSGLGAGSAITNQYGFIAEADLTQATNNYGFYGNIAAATGRWNLYMGGTANNYLAGRLGVGTSFLTNRSLAVYNQITGSAVYYVILSGGVVQSDVFSEVSYFRSAAQTAAASFTLSNLYHFNANLETNGIGAGSTVTNQYGYFVNSNVIGATNNYGFYGNIASGTGRWNLYMNGTAANYLAGNLGIGTTNPTYRLDINGSFRASGSITATSGSDYFDISHDITQPAQTGSQVYEVNITPTFRYAAPNQTQTALRVAATFSGSTALSSSQSNIIADFGSTSAGSQLVINDTTSGSIYMVNDVSGLPIIEANSNWDVFIYDYPNVVLKKTGSQIDITGTLRVSGSFILPLSQSTSPETGSAYWSGSFLYIYDGTQYRSASFS